jgi:hypothetical protein
MSSLAEVPSHPRSQLYTRLAKLISQAISRSQSIFPSLLAASFEQADLFGLRFKR